MTFRSLSRIIIVLALLALGTLGLALWLLVRGEWAGQLRLAEEHARSLAIAHGAALTQTLTSYDRDLLELHHLIAAGAGQEFLAQSPAARTTARSELRDILLLDADGEILLRTEPGPNPDVKQRPYFTQLRDNHERNLLYISPPLQSMVDQGAWFMAISRRLNDPEGNFAGAVVMIIDIDQLAGLLAPGADESNSSLAVVTLAGKIIFRIPRVAGDTGIILPAIAAAQGQFPQDMVRFLRSRFDGRQRIVVTRPIERYPLLANATLDMEPLLADRNRLLATVGAVYLLAILLGGAITRLLLLSLRARAEQSRILTQREADLRLLTENMVDVIWTMDGNSRYTYVSPSIINHRGYTPEELLAEPMEKSVTPDSYREIVKVLGEIAAAVAAGKLTSPVDSCIEVQQPCRDGSLIWSEVLARLFYNDQGKLEKIHGVTRNISERKAVEQALKRSNAELEHFAYAASHDLRQPLRMINGFIQLLAKDLDPKLNHETRQAMTYIQEGAERMDQMLVALLEYSRVGRIGEPMAPVASRRLVEEALIYLNPAIRESGAQVRISGEWPQIRASYNEGVRLFQNLLDNALKYRAPERPPQIEVAARRLDSRWEFSVSDNGIGIDPTQQDRLFKVFQRLHPPRGPYPGSGVGLALCRKIVERHGGTIWLESAGADQGSKFIFTLPADDPPLPA